MPQGNQRHFKNGFQMPNMWPQLNAWPMPNPWPQPEKETQTRIIQIPPIQTDTQSVLFPEAA